MPRRRMQQTFQLAEQAGEYDEYPVMPEGVDPQLTLSQNTRPQPFFLVCQKDSILVQMSGRAKVEFRSSGVNFFFANPGDFVYVPAGTPHRILPQERSLHYRYKAEQAGLEAVAWFCEGCGGEVSRVTWDTAQELPQEGYLRATEEFNANAAARRCKCGAEHPPVDISGNRWREIAHELRSTQDEDDDW